MFNERKKTRNVKVLFLALFCLMAFVVAFLIFKVVSNKKVYKASDDILREVDEETKEFLKKYKLAVKNKDADTLLNLFSIDKAKVSSQYEELLREDFKGFEDFYNEDEFYFIDGFNVNEKIVYIKMYLKFINSDKKVPLFLSLYLKKDDSQYRAILKENLSENQRERLNTFDASEEIQKVYSSYKEELKNVVLSDVEVSENYKKLTNESLNFEEVEKALKRRLEEIQKEENAKNLD